MHHHVDTSRTRNRWNRDYPPVLTLAPGDTVSLAMKDASDGQVRPGMTLAEFAAIDKTRIHALTGPVAVDGAEPGDALEIEILGFRHEGWAWTSIMPGLGALGDEFSEPFLHIWKLEEGTTRSIPGVTLDLHPFCGVVGVQRAEPGEFRTRPPGTFGGNMDVRHLGAGARLWLPVFTPGAGLCAGDAHAAQGDGEVCGTAVETAMDVSVRLSVRRDMVITAPQYHLPQPTAGQAAAGPYHVCTGVGPDLLEAARDAIRATIEHLAEHHGFERQEAYALASVAVDLRIHEVVDAPNWVVGAFLPEAVVAPAG